MNPRLIFLLNTFKDRDGAITSFAGGPMQESWSRPLNRTTRRRRGVGGGAAATGEDGWTAGGTAGAVGGGGESELEGGRVAVGDRDSDEPQGRGGAGQTVAGGEGGPERTRIRGADFFGSMGMGVDPATLPLLRDGGADLSAKSSDGKDLLLTAAQIQNWAAAQVLLQRGMRPADDAGFRAQVEAATRASYRQPGLDELVTYLKQQEK